jgi:menaquinol-cytochrome c reductase iron-sulfur subunit
MLLVDLLWSQTLALLNPYILALLIAALVVGLLVALGMAVKVAMRALLRRTSRHNHQTSRAAPLPLIRTTNSQSDTDKRQQQTDEQRETENEQPKMEGESGQPTRRRFLTALSIALGGIWAAIVGIPALGVLLSPLLRRPAETWRAVGRVDDFPVGDTVKVTFLDPTPLPWAGFAAESAAWLRRRSEEEFRAFSVYCTHTGCPVAWFTDAELFMCPCHGGVFDGDGRVVSGPPERPLSLHPVRIRNGQVEIRTLREPLPVWEWARVSRCADETERTASMGKDCSEQLTRSDGSSEVES